MGEPQRSRQQAIAPTTKDQFAGGLSFETNSNLSTPTQKSTPVASYMAWDVRFAFRGGALPTGFGKTWNVAVGVNNITNRRPPISPYAFQDNNADVASYSPIGRFGYVSASLKF